MEPEIGFNAYIQSKLLVHTFVVVASSDLGRPFRPRQKRWGLCWEKSKLSRYDRRAKEALPPSITVIRRVIFICNHS